VPAVAAERVSGARRSAGTRPSQQDGTHGRLTRSLEAVAELSTPCTNGHYDIRLEAAVARCGTRDGCASSTTRCRSAAGGATKRRSRSSGGRDAVPVETHECGTPHQPDLRRRLQIMRLFIAREAVDKHFGWRPIVNPASTMGSGCRPVEVGAVLASGYARWLSSLDPALRGVRSAGHTRSRNAPPPPGPRHLPRDGALRPALEKRHWSCFSGSRLGPSSTRWRRRVQNPGRCSRRRARPAARARRGFCRRRGSASNGTSRGCLGGRPGDLPVASEVLKGQHAWLEQGIVSYEHYTGRPKPRTRRRQTRPHGRRGGPACRAAEVADSHEIRPCEAMSGEP